jgi:VWFA-related protein
MGALWAQETEPVLRVTTRLVQVSVVVEDKKGEPIRDLTRDDFTVIDNNQPRKIAVFSLDVAQGNAAPPAPTAAPTPLLVANRVARPEEKRIGVTVVVFDALNIRGLDQFTYGKKQLVEFLRTLQAGDPVALYFINGPVVRVAHDFTDDASALIDAAKRLTDSEILSDAGAAPSLGEASSVGDVGGGYFATIAGFLQQASQADEAARLRMTTEWTLTALEAIARHLTGIPGRKNLIWVSNGYPMNIGLSPEAFKAAAQVGVNQELFDYSDRTNRIARILAEAEVVVYPVDPAGVRTDSRYKASYAGHPSNNRMITAGERAAPTIATIRAIAKQTGGLAFYNNEIAGNMRRAVDDGRVTYTLGFYPSQESWDGKYHTLKVSVDRKGAEVRTRDGYFAKAVAELAPEREEALKLAVASPLEGAAIGVKLQLPSNPLESSDQDLVVFIDAHDIQFESKEGRMHADVDVVFAQTAHDGSILKGERKTLALNLTADSYQEGMKNGLSLREHLAVNPTASRLRVVVRDAATGAEGSVSVPVKRRANS